MRKNNLLPLLIFILTFFLLTFIQSLLIKVEWFLYEDAPSTILNAFSLVLFGFILFVPYIIMKITLFIGNKYSDSLLVKLFFKNWIAPIILLIISIFLDAKYTLPNIFIFAIYGMSFFTGNFVTLLWARIVYKYFNKDYLTDKSCAIKITTEILKIILIDVLIWIVAMLFLLCYGCIISIL